MDDHGHAHAQEDAVMDAPYDVFKFKIQCLLAIGATAVLGNALSMKYQTISYKKQQFLPFRKNMNKKITTSDQLLLEELIACPLFLSACCQLIPSNDDDNNSLFSLYSVFLFYHTFVQLPSFRRTPSHEIASERQVLCLRVL